MGLKEETGVRRRLGDETGQGEDNGKEDYEAQAVDEGRLADAKDACAGESQNGCNCTQAQAERVGDVSIRVKARRDVFDPVGVFTSVLTERIRMVGKRCVRLLSDS
jgi:hypothetical protein